MPSLVGDSGQVLGVLGWALTRICNLTSCEIVQKYALILVQSKSSILRVVDKHEPSLTLRVAVNKSLPRLQSVCRCVHRVAINVSGT